MIYYPITNRDLLRSVMARVPAAGVVYHDEQLQRFQADAALGLCSLTIVREPEVKTVQTVYEPDGTSRTVVTTVQHHHVEVQYSDPEDEFEVKLSITSLPVRAK
jgi:hypothetical protein